MYYLLKTLENLKTIPILSPLASVPDHSPPTIWWEVVRKRGDRMGMSSSRYGSYYNYIFIKKKQNKNTEAKMSKNNLCAGFDLVLNSMATTKLNEFYPLYFRSDQPCAIVLRGFFRANNKFNHNNKHLIKGGAL